MNFSTVSPLTLSFVGDGVYTLAVRRYLSQVNRSVGELHKLAVKYVNATAQSKAFKVIEPLLTETEMSVFKRGRNAHTTSTPQNSTVGEYHTATGVEALFGYLYLFEQHTRIDELFAVIFENEA